MKCVELFSVQLTYAPFTFSIGQAFVGLGLLSIAIAFIIKLFDR